MKQKFMALLVMAIAFAMSMTIQAQEVTTTSAENAEATPVTTSASDEATENDAGDAGEVTDTDSGEDTDTDSGEDTDTDSGENTDTDSGENTDTDSGENTDTDSGENTDTDSGENTDTDSGENTDTDSGEDTDTDSGENTDTDSGENTDTDSGEVTDTDSGENTDTDSGEDTDTDSGEDTDTDSGEDTDTDSGEDTDTDSGEDTDTDSGEDTDTDSGEDTDTDSGEDTDTDSGEDTDTDSGEVTDTDSGEVTDTDSSEDTDTDSGEDTDTDSGEDTDTDSGEDTDTSNGEDGDADNTDSEDDQNTGEVIELEIIVEGFVTDESGNPLGNVTVTLGELTAVSDEQGYYQIPGLVAGSYTLTGEKEDYVFQEMQITLTDENPFLEVNLASLAGGTIEGHNMVVVGVHTCEADTNVNSVTLTTGEGETVYNFNTGFTSEGSRLSSADFDTDESSDVAVSEIGQGNDVYVFNAKGERFAQIITNSAQKGANSAFGDIDGDGEFEIVVSSQAESSRVYLYESTGKAIRAIIVSDEDIHFDIATGDVNGDGTDEIIVGHLVGTEGDDNVFVYDSEGELLNSFSALDGKGIVVAAGDIDGDGTAEIITGQAEEAEEYTVAAYEMDGSVVLETFNAFGGNDILVRKGLRAKDKNDDKVTLCHNGKTTTVSASAVQSHLNHGDTLGQCGSNSQIDEDDSTEVEDNSQEDDSSKVDVEDDSEEDDSSKVDVEDDSEEDDSSKVDDDDDSKKDDSSSKVDDDEDSKEDNSSKVDDDEDSKEDNSSEVDDDEVSENDDSSEVDDDEVSDNDDSSEVDDDEVSENNDSSEVDDDEVSENNDSTEVEDTEDNTPCQLYTGNGVVLAVGDVDGDEQAEIIVSKAGGQQVRIYKADGSLAEYFNAVADNAVISSLGYGSNMAVELPVTTTLPADPEEPLEDITIIGTPEEPIVVEDRVIKGTVRMAYTLISSVKLLAGANLQLMSGVQFTSHDAIPSGVDLTKTLGDIYVSSTIQGMETDYEPVNLTNSIVKDEPSVLEDIEVIIGDKSGAAEVTQDITTGQLQVDVGETCYSVLPTEVKQADDDTAAGVSINDDGSVTFVTEGGQQVSTQPAVQDNSEFVKGLNYINLYDLIISSKGRLTTTDATTAIPYFGKPDFLSVIAAPDMPLGISMTKTRWFGKNTNGAGKMVVFVFIDDDGMKRQQMIYPTPANEALLTSLGASDSNADDVQLHAGVGTMSFRLQGRSYFGFLDYHVEAGEKPSSGVVEFNPTEDLNEDGIEDIEIVYPDGQQQDLYVIEDDSIAEPIDNRAEVEAETDEE